jgi:hypothetical protein
MTAASALPGGAQVLRRAKNARLRMTSPKRLVSGLAKSFVWNILRVKYLESRFCADQSGLRECKVFEIKILTEVI